MRLSNKPRGQGYVKVRLKIVSLEVLWSIRGSYQTYPPPLSQMLHNHLQQIIYREAPISSDIILTLYNFTNLTLLPISTPFYQIPGGFKRTFTMEQHTNRGRLLLRRPDPVPRLTCIWSNIETGLSKTCLVSETFEFQTPLGTSVLL